LWSVSWLVVVTNPLKSINHCMKLQYSKVCSFLQQVYESSKKFKNEVPNVRDTARLSQAQRFTMLQKTEAQHITGKPTALS
jgi:hypothetical protein